MNHRRSNSSAFPKTKLFTSFAEKANLIEGIIDAFSKPYYIKKY